MSQSNLIATHARRLGKLYLIPTPLGDAPLSMLLPADVIARCASLQHWIAESAKSCRSFLKQVGATHPLLQPIQLLSIQELPKHSQTDGRAMLAALIDGNDVGLVSEAGAPGVADPGALIVAAAHELGARVVPLVGPSAILLTLMASGLNGQQFAFNGYLPKDPRERSSAVKALEARSQQQQQTQVCIETPYRNAALLQTLLTTLKPTTRLCVAAGLTTATESVVCLPVSSWLSLKIATASGDSLDQPAIFAWLA